MGFSVAVRKKRNGFQGFGEEEEWDGFNMAIDSNGGEKMSLGRK